MQNIIILGAKGQLGSDLCQVLSEHRLDYIALSSKDFNVLTDDLSAKLSAYAPTIIINCIATTNVDGCEDKPDHAFLVNSSFTSKLAKFCNQHAITLFHLSTDYVFDGKKSTPYTEDDTPNPQNIYGLSKVTGDLAVQAYHDKYFILRVSSLFGIAGASGKGGNFITTMQRLGKERDSLSVIADQITCPTATLDIARCIRHLIINEINDYGVYNCVSSNCCSWFEFARQIFILSGLDETKLHKASFAEYVFKAKRPQYGVMSTKKLSKYYVMPTWQESLSEYFSAIGTV